MKPIERIMVPTDFSAGAAAAAEVAAELAIRLGASVDIVTVVDTSAFEYIYRDVAYRAQRIADVRGRALSEAQQFADDHFNGIERMRMKVHVRDGDVFSSLMHAARDLGSDMIVMGTHGRTGIAHLVIGSIAEKMVRASPIPVLTVRARPEVPESPPG
jgi:nucleotide-binding universal stress UspA family protein